MIKHDYDPLEDSDFPFIPEYVQILTETPPSAISGFKLSDGPLPPESMDSASALTSWRIACSCGSDHGRVRGYPLREYAECKLTEEEALYEYLSPITFECSACAKVTEMLDCAKHGYNGAFCGGAVTIRGEGEPTTIPCRTCGTKEFVVTVGFGYWGACFDAFEDCREDGEEIDPQENFNGFACYGKCKGCGAVSEITTLGDL